MHPPAPDERWELRESRVYGSRHVGYFPTQAAAVAEADRRIELAGGEGNVGCVSNGTRVVYFSEHEEDE